MLTGIVNNRVYQLFIRLNISHQDLFSLSHLFGCYSFFPSGQQFRLVGVEPVCHTERGRINQDVQWLGASAEVRPLSHHRSPPALPFLRNLTASALLALHVLRYGSAQIEV